MKKNFDPDNTTDLEWLDSWCTDMFNTVIPKAKSSGNPITVNTCCNAFTKRTYTAKAGHPKENQINLWHWMQCHNITDLDSFKAHFITAARERKEKGLVCIAPSLDTEHVSKAESMQLYQKAEEDRHSIAGRLDEAVDLIFTLRKSHDQLLLLNETLWESNEKCAKERDEAELQLAEARKEVRWLKSIVFNCKYCIKSLTKTEPKERERSREFTK